MRLAALHDLGKATPSFQKKSPGARAKLEQEGFVFAGASEQYHGDLTSCILDKESLATIGLICSDDNSIFNIKMLLGGHHGLYPEFRRLNRVLPGDMGNEKWVEARHAMLDFLSSTLGPLQIDLSIDDSNGATFVVLSGLVSVSDWIASAEGFFPYAGDISDLREYGEAARLRASDAINTLRWSTATCDARTFDKMFDEIEEPYPLQRAVEEIGHTLSDPGILIIEAPMGEGKTEAALYLMERWNSTLHKNGAYIALPTQATANQMFSRVLGFLRGARYENGVNLALVHGHASMDDTYLQLKIGRDDEEDVRATEWFDYRRRGLLSPFGVGTIDQALLSVIPSKYFFVRLFGLAGKTVILDEVHAYDLYTSTILDKMLEWLSAIGSNVILLSATLTDERCRQLLKAYAGRELEIAPGYPRISYCAGPSNSLQFPSANQTGIRRQAPIKIRWCPAEISTIADEIAIKLEGGGCVAIICNTVRKAQMAYHVLEERFRSSDVEVGLFHSRYMFKDRMRIEDDCFRKFGRNRDAKRRILVATQVIEQSLDLDFDLMITEVAPIDLILQRAGRLHRHMRIRPEPLSSPELWIMEPDDAEHLDFGSSENVYSKYTLMKSYLVLRDKNRIELPDKIKDLIEKVYSPHSDRDYAERASLLQEERERMEKAATGVEDAAYSTILPHPSKSQFWKYTSNRRSDDESEEHGDHLGSTRLGLPTARAIVLFEHDGRRYLDCCMRSPIDIYDLGKEDACRLMGNEVTITGHSLAPLVDRIPTPSNWKKQALLRLHHPLIFRTDHGGEKDRWTARVGPHLLTIDSEYGLQEVME